MNRYAIYHRRENGTCSRREVSEPTDHAAREYAALVVRMRAAYGERLTVDTIERIEYVKIPTDTEGK